MIRPLTPRPCHTGTLAALPEPLLAALGGPAALPQERQAAWLQWLAVYQAALRAEGVADAERQAGQDSANPKYIPRQHLMQLAIEAAEKGDMGPTRELLELLRRWVVEGGGGSNASGVRPGVHVGLRA
jgi:uncharacterized protein YdiU (UPF0061 family)